MDETSFFDESREQSRVKAEIVGKYFWAWANVIMPTVKRRRGKIAYIDLFAGPGRYDDGTKSTPVLILEQAIKNPDLCEMLVTIFNDVDAQNKQSLKRAINQIPHIAELKNTPQVFNEDVGERIVQMFETMQLAPTLFFVDPWGYKGLSLKLINSVLKDWGCDCVFFFNYNRINMGLSNPAVRTHMNALFGDVRADQLRLRLKNLSPVERELTIVEELTKALGEMGGKFVLPFTFKTEQGNRTSHHLIFVTKHFKGYEIMKDIMARESSEAQQGVPSFEYNPASSHQPLLFEFSRPLDELQNLLRSHFTGKRLTMLEVYREHSVGRRYVKANYKKTLLNLEQGGKIKTEPPAKERKTGTFGDKVIVTFP